MAPFWRFCAAFSLCWAAGSHAAPLTSGNLVVYRIGTGAIPLVSSGSPVFLDEYTPAGVLVQSIAMPTVVDGIQKRLVASGTATSEGFLSRSADGRYVILTGYDAAIPHTGSVASASSATVNRVVGRVDGAGAIDTSTALTDANSGDNFRGVCSLDGTQFWTAGAASGLRYAASLGATTSLQLNTTNQNLRQPLVFAGQLYIGAGNGNVRLGTVGSGLPTTAGQVLTTLPGLPTATPFSPTAFFLADLNANVAGVDTLYMADEGSSGGLLKYSFDGTTWTARGTAGAAADAYRGLAAEINGGTVDLYAVRKGGSGATGGGEIVSLQDATGSTGTLTGTPTVLATAQTNRAFRGVAIAPQTDLSLDIAAPAAAFTNGEFYYTLTVHNNGLTNVANAEVQFTLPAGLTFVSASGGGFSASESAGVVTLNGDVPGSSSQTLTVTVTAAAAGLIATPAGAAIIDPQNLITETSETNNTSSAAGDIIITDAADLTVDLTVPTTALTGENFTYTLTVSNEGLVGANSVAVQFTLPAGLIYVGAAGSSFTITESAGVVSFSGGTLAVNASAVLTVTATTLADGIYTAGTGAALIDPANAIAESHETNNSSAALPGTAVTTADLTLAKVHNGTFQAGDPVATYTITVSNAGTGPSKGTVAVSDPLPTGLTAVSLAGTGWTITQGTGGSVSATRSDALTADSSYPPLTLTVAIALNSATTLTNTATVAGGGEINSSNNSGTDVVSVAGAGPGVIAFAAAPNGVRYEVNEELGTISIPLVRAGGRTGAVSVQVGTTAGTATSPADFTTLNNQLVAFADGEVSKTVVVGIAKTVANEVNETFSLTLANPQGGAALGALASTEVLILEPDTTRPTITIRSPAANARVPEGMVSVSGRALDAKGLRVIEASLNGGPYILANPITAATATADNYSLNITPIPGLNQVAVRAIDFRGNVSTPLARAFTYVVKRPLTLNVIPASGYGTVALTPNEPLSALELGKSYTLKAVPVSDKVWNGWTAAALTLTAAQAAATGLTFTMSEGLTITGAFTDDPFTADVIGDFNGLVLATGAVTPSHLTHGFITVEVTSSGSFTGTLKVGGLSLPFKGLFDNTGHARFGTTLATTLSLERPNLTDLVLAFDLDIAPAGTHKITGSLGERSPVGVTALSTIEADRAAFDGKTPGTSATSAFYTAALPSQAQLSGLAAIYYPQGDGMGSLTLTKAGVMSFAGILADGSTVTASAPLSAEFRVPLHALLYKNGGSLGGWLGIDSTRADTDVTAANLRWFKPHTGGQHYPFGWPEGLTISLIGAAYAVPVGDSILPDLSKVTDANALLSLSQGGLSSRVEKGVSITPKNVVTRVPANDTSFSLVIAAATGRIAGYFTHTDGNPSDYDGIILQKGANRRAFGHFLTATPKVIDGAGQSGVVSLKTRFNPRPTLVISEFMAKNESTLMDDNGDPSDWIEIYNPGATAVSLLDWSLTDSASNLTKWRFPDISLGPQQFLLVWASNKNRTNPAAPLHTNFALSNEGEYLALVRPDGITIEHQFAPLFPALADDESYGINFDGIPLISPGDTAHYSIPANGAQGTSWTTKTFNDAGWSRGPTGIGFGINVPGFKVRQVTAKPSFGGVWSVASCEDLLGRPTGNVDVASEKTVISQQVNFVGDGSAGHYGGDEPPPGGIGEPYAIKATGVIEIPTAGTYVFGLNSDDGGRIKIDDVAVMTDDTNHGPEDHLSGPVTLTAGPHTVEIIMWEGGGGDELEFYTSPGSATEWSDTFKLVGGIGGLTVSTPPLNANSAGSAVATNVQTKMRNVRSSCYVRMPFTATGVTTFSGLSLRMRYNDGFVAYLNGTEVARRNAPATPAFDSAATASRTSTEALVSEVIDLTAALPHLANGANVLAIHGLNDTVGDSAFLVLPELSAVAGLTGNIVFFSPSLSGVTATPGALNASPLYLGKVGDIQFSLNHGILEGPRSLTLTSATPGAQIRYTLDGSTPTATHGVVYSTALSIAKTTVVRAAGFKTNYQASKVDTRSYLLLDDVITQSANGARPAAGWPTGTINGQVADYGMDPEIVNNTNPEIGGASRVKQALTAIPTISLVTDLPNLFDPNNGIWVNPGARGFTWERPCSMELIGDGNTPAGGFQVNCGMRVRGGFSRSGDNPKHGFHIYFRSAYGASKLNYPLFGNEGEDVFDQIDLRTAQNYSWSFGGDGSNTFIREESTRELQGAMGQPYGRGRYYHVYLNGQYWGLYNSEERTEADYAETYLGGSSDDYDVVKAEQDSGYTTGVTDGNLEAWEALWTKSRAHALDPSDANYFAMQGKAADGVAPTADPVLLDVDNLIDYMLLTFWTGNRDGATSAFLGDNAANNWFGIRNRVGTQGFKFFAHDFEHTFLNPDEDRTGPFNTANVSNFNYSNPMFLHHDLRPNAEYRMRWADRAHRHLFNNGALVAENVQARMNARSEIVNSVIIAESARWGDSKTAIPLTRLNWQEAKNYVINSYVPLRGSRVLQQLRNDGLYPSIDAPTLSQFGGPIASGSEVIITGHGGTLHFTTDGSDPRLLGGGVNSAAQVYTSSTIVETILPLNKVWKYLGDGTDQGIAWRGAAFDDSLWASGAGELGYGDGDEATTVPFVDTNPGAGGDQKNATTYFRTTVTLADVSGITAASLRLKYDDGAVIYVNGVEAVRTGNLPTNPAYNQFTSGGTPDENSFTDFVIDPSLFVEGINTIAAEVHQLSSDSTDISFAASLTTTRTDTPTPLHLTGTGARKLKVRALNGSEWSALVDATFDVRLVPDLVLTNTHNGNFTTGTTGTYTLTVSNQGTAATSGAITFTDTLPAGLTATSLTGSGWMIVQSTGSTVTATRSDALAPSASFPPLTLSAAIAGTAPAFVTNSATVSGGGDITPQNNTASDIAPVAGAGPSQLTFSASHYDAPEESGVVKVTVLRTGIPTNLETATLSTSHGTAKSPADYEQRTVTVDFLDGETSHDVFIGISNDSATEFNETFTVTLSNVTGASLGEYTTATVRILEADVTAPKITLTTPTASARVINQAVTIKGTATDNKGLDRVEFALNGGPFTKALSVIAANGASASYTASLNATPGTNTVVVRSIDMRGVTSEPIARTFTFVPLRPLTLTVQPGPIAGTVSITPATSFSALQVGTAYTLKATPKSGFIFERWTGPGINSEAGTLTFTMSEGLAITATFAPNPFVTSVTGEYNGLVRAIDTIEPGNGNHGFIHIKVTSTGSFTGKLRMDGQSFPLTGMFNSAGLSRFGAAHTGSAILARTEDTSLVLALNLDTHIAGTHQITGTVGEQQRTGITPMSTLVADRAWYDGKTPATSVTAASFSIQILALPANPLYPPGTGSGKITVTKAGLLTFTGTLADSTSATASVPLSQAKIASIFSALYPGQTGSIGGLIKLDGASGNAGLIGEDMFWFRPPLSDTAFPLGWPGGVSFQVLRMP